MTEHEADFPNIFPGTTAITMLSASFFNRSSPRERFTGNTASITEWDRLDGLCHSLFKAIWGALNRRTSHFR